MSPALQAGEMALPLVVTDGGACLPNKSIFRVEKTPGSGHHTSGGTAGMAQGSAPATAPSEGVCVCPTHFSVIAQGCDTFF